MGNFQFPLAHPRQYMIEFGYLLKNEEEKI